MAGTPAPIAGLTQRSPATDFIDNRLSALHPAFANAPTRFDAVSDRYVPLSAPNTMESSGTGQGPRQLPPAVGAMKFWDKIFPDAMALFKAENKEPKTRTVDGHAYCIRTKANWTEVYDELQLARTVYDDKGARHHVKKGLRVFFDKVSVVRPALQLIPQADYLSPVVGALQIIIDAAKESGSVREEVAGAFDEDELEQNFADLETFLAIFPGDQVVEKKSVQLVVSILKATEEALRYYLDNIVWRASKVVFLGEEYQRDLRNSLAQIKTSSQALIHEAQTSSAKQVSEIWNRVHTSSGKLLRNDCQMLKNQQNMMDNQQGMMQKQDNIHEAQQLSADAQNSIKALLEGYIRDQDQRAQQQQRQIELLAEQNAYLVAESLARRTPSPQPQVDWYMSQESLRALLAIPDIDDSDLQYIEQRTELLPPGHREKAELVARTGPFRNFVAALESQVLLVHGNFEGTHYVSALSSFCVTMVHILKATDRFLPVVFFCGCHVDQHDRYSGGQGMIRSLIAQLLRQQAFDTRFLPHQVDLNRVERGDLESLCALFSWLAKGVPEKTNLVCFIDGIKYYEREEYATSMGLVLRCLFDLLREPGVRTVMKILIASPSETTIVRRHPAFQEGRNMLTLESLQSPGLGPSNSRLSRELGNNIE